MPKSDAYLLPWLRDLKPGAHLCCLYETEEEHQALLTPFLRQGLERGEKVVYIVDKRTAQIVLDYLRKDGVDVEPFLEGRQLSILSVKDSYLKEGVFDPDGMIALLKTETERALNEGYSALRVTGEMSWALRNLPGSERLIEYESKLNNFFHGSQCIAICQYDRRRFPPELLLDVLVTHPTAIIGTEVYDNFYFMGPEDFLGPDLPGTTLKHRIDALRTRKRIDEALREKEEQYRKTLDGMLEGCQIIGFDWRYLYVNDAVARHGRRSKDWLLGRTMMEVYPGIEDTEMFAVLRHCMEKRTSHRMENEFTFPDGTKGWFELSIQPISEGLFILSLDITERKRAEEELRRLKEFNENIVQRLEEGIMIEDADGIMTFANPKVTEMLGYSMEELIGEHWRKISSPDSLDRMEEETRKRPTGISSRYEAAVVSKSGNKIPIIISATPLLENGEYKGVLSVFTDITERKKAEDALRRSKEFSETILDSMNDAISIIDVRDFRIIDANRVFLDKLGLKEEEVIGKTCYEITHHRNSPCTPPEDTCPLQESVKTGKHAVFDHLHYSKDGGKIYVEVSASPIKDEMGGVFQVVHVARDITERKQAEVALRESEEKYSTLVERGNDGIIIIQDGLLRFVNSKMNELSGFIGEEVIGKPFLDFVSPDYREVVADRYKKRMSREDVPSRYEIELLSNDGEKIPIEVNASLIEYKGKPAVMAIIRDITEQKKAEAALKSYANRLKESNRLKDLFTDIMHHDLQNPVSVVKGMSELMMDDMSSKDSRRQIEVLRSSAMRMMGLIESASMLSKLVDKEELAFEMRDINAVFKDVVRDFEPLLKEKMIELDYNARGERVAPVHDMLREVFTNLLSNSVKYSPPKSRVTIDIHDEDEAWRVMVADQGEGVPDEYKKAVFERFERGGKKGVKGSGLGLAIVKRIVELHNGEVWVEDNTPRGSIFNVRIPKNYEEED